MNAILASIFIFSAMPVLAHASIDGEFICNDTGRLSVTKDRNEAGYYYASLTYPDGSASTLAQFHFPGEALRGEMLRDDEDQMMGYVTIVAGYGGTRLQLAFTGAKSQPLICGQ